MTAQSGARGALTGLGPMETATISFATLRSFSRTCVHASAHAEPYRHRVAGSGRKHTGFGTASSTAISQNGFIDMRTLAVSTPILSGRTRTFTA